MYLVLNVQHLTSLTHSPGLIPRVGEINYQQDLEENEEQSTNQSNTHDSWEWEWEWKRQALQTCNTTRMHMVLTEHTLDTTYTHTYVHMNTRTQSHKRIYTLTHTGTYTHTLTLAENQVLCGRNEEESDNDPNDEKPLEEPESILDVRSRVFGTPHTDHDHPHHQEEQREAEHDPVHRYVADDMSTVLCQRVGDIQLEKLNINVNVVTEETLEGEG